MPLTAVGPLRANGSGASVSCGRFLWVVACTQQPLWENENCGRSPVSYEIQLGTSSGGQEGTHFSDFRLRADVMRDDLRGVHPIVSSFTDVPEGHNRVRMRIPAKHVTEIAAVLRDTAYDTFIFVVVTPVMKTRWLGLVEVVGPQLIVPLTEQLRQSHDEARTGDAEDDLNTL